MATTKPEASDTFHGRLEVRKELGQDRINKVDIAHDTRSTSSVAV